MAGTCSTTEKHFCRMLKKARSLTCPTLAATSPARPESAKTASSPGDAPRPKQAAAREGPKRTWGYVEDLNDARTLHGERRVLARRGRAGEKSDFFSILLVASFEGRGTGQA
jgi:hypothetical protein